MAYRIVLKCESAKDEEKFGRDLQINNFDSADATFKALVKSALDELIDPYVVEIFGQDGLTRARLERK